MISETEMMDFASPSRRAGLGLVGVFGLLSAFSTLSLLLYFLRSSLLRSFRSSEFSPRSGPSPEQGQDGLAKFINSTLGRYLIYLIFCDFLQGFAFSVNLNWASRGKIHEGGACTLQGSLMQAGDMGGVFWSLMIAFQTFCLLFLQAKPHPAIELCASCVIWTATVILPILGSMVIQDQLTTGSFWSLSGAWCWVGNPYQIYRLPYLYIWIFFNLFCCFCMYSLIYLKLVGIIEYIPGLHLRLHLRSGGGGGDVADHARPSNANPTFTFRPSDSGLQPHQTSDPQTNVGKPLVKIARRLMWYPLVYAIVIIPVAICRMGVLAGWTPPFGLFVFGGICFASSGLSNALLFLFTRHSFIQRRTRSKAHSAHQVEITINVTHTPDSYPLTPLRTSKVSVLNLEEEQEDRFGKAAPDTSAEDFLEGAEN